MDDQAKNLREKISKKREQQAQTISVVSGKGGVGKSNFALNFSLELIALNKKVILFDLDVGMGNIDILLGLNAKQTLIDMLDQQLSIFSIIETGPKDLRYIAGGSNLADLFTFNKRHMDYFSNEYEKLIKHYDYIIFDLGAGVSEENIFFNLASDECIVITTPEPTSITDAYSFIKQIVNKEQKMPIYVVMNRTPSRRIGENTLARFDQVISQFLHIKITQLGILPNDETVSKAVMKQTPYILLNGRAPISRAMKQLTKNYLNNKDILTNHRSLSFGQKLKKLFWKDK